MISSPPTSTPTILSRVNPHAATKASWETNLLPELLTTFLEHGSDGVWRVDTTGQTLYANAAMAKMVGYTAEEMLQLRSFDLVHPDDLRRAQESWQERMHGRPERAEWRLRRKDGRYVWGDAQAVPIRNAQGVIEGAVAIFRDITERRQAEALAAQRLLEIESLYRTAPVGLCLIDRSLRYLRVNETLAAINGQSVANHIGRSIHEVIPDLVAAVEPAYRSVFATGVPVLNQEISGCLASQPGVNRSWLVNYVPVRNPEGEVEAVNVVIHEITERKRLERELGRQEERLRAALVASQTGTFHWCPVTNTLAWDGALKQLFGVPADQDVQDLEQFIALVHPDDRDKVREHCGKCAREGTDFAMDFRVRLPHGEIRWLHDRGRMIHDESGRPLYMAGACTDITARVSALERVTDLESRQRAMLDHLPVGVWFLDAEGTIVYANPAGRKIWGGARYVALEQLGEYKAWWHGTGEEIRPEEWAGAQAVLHRRANLDQVIDIACFDGQRKTILNSAVPIELPDGTLRGVVVFNLDITAQMQAQAGLRQAHDELERRVAERTASLQQSLADLEAFSYSISHDIRTPLRALQGFSDLLLKDGTGKLDSVSLDLAGRIHRAAHRLDVLIRDVLSFSRVSRNTLELGSVDLDEVLSDVIDHYPTLQAARARITIARPLGRVHAHAALVSQIFANLLTNAVKFVVPNQVPEVTMTSSVDHGLVHVAITDNGIGIAPEHHDYIFNIFARVHPDFAYEGTGIGLAIVKRAVERLGGNIALQSAVGRGSTFTVSLPVSR